MIDALSFERFQDLVASFGADPDRWPDDLRGAAVGALVESGAARDALRDAAELDADLDTVSGQIISSKLVDRVLAIADAPVERTTRTFSNIVRHTAPYAAAAAIALVVGLAVPSPFRDAIDTEIRNGIAVVEPAATEDTSDGLATLALVDVRSAADDETDIDDALTGEITLAGIPLL